ncbi:MAG: RimK-like ATPgrasp N-terminal domain-containing protein, partial [Burkholderiaceae bacterium]
MNALLVASPSLDWICNLPGSRALSAQDYLTPGCRGGDAARVVNLGAATDYQSEAYYVTLVAEARG